MCRTHGSAIVPGFVDDSSTPDHENRGPHEEVGRLSTLTKEKDEDPAIAAHPQNTATPRPTFRPNRELASSLAASSVRSNDCADVANSPNVDGWFAISSRGSARGTRERSEREEPRRIREVSCNLSYMCPSIIVTVLNFYADGSGHPDYRPLLEHGDTDHYCIAGLLVNDDQRSLSRAVRHGRITFLPGSRTADGRTQGFVDFCQSESEATMGRASGWRHAELFDGIRPEFGQRPLLLTLVVVSPIT